MGSSYLVAENVENGNTGYWFVLRGRCVGGMGAGDVSVERGLWICYGLEMGAEPGSWLG